MKKAILATIVTLGLFATACSSGNPTQAPTHRWASAESADALTYRNDHAKCSSQANISDSAKSFETQSEEFSTYKSCMNTKGYVLTASRP